MLVLQVNSLGWTCKDSQEVTPLLLFPPPPDPPPHTDTHTHISLPTLLSLPPSLTSISSIFKEGHGYWQGTMVRQYAPARASPWHTYSTGQSIDEPGVVTVKSPNLTSQSLRTFEPYSSENVRKPALSFFFLLHTLSLPSKPEGAEAGASPNPTPGGVVGTLLRAHHPGSISSTTSNTLTLRGKNRVWTSSYPGWRLV